MRVVADTNVLISATFWTGASEAIVAKAESNEYKAISIVTPEEFLRT